MKTASLELGPLETALQALRSAVATAGAEEIRRALPEIDELRAAAWLRIWPAEAQPAGDRLLAAAEAAPRIGVTVKSLYRGKWPFRRELSPGRIRFSEKGIEEYLANLGRAVARGPSLR